MVCLRCTNNSSGSSEDSGTLPAKEGVRGWFLSLQFGLLINRKLFVQSWSIAFATAVIACGPNEAGIQATVDAKVAGALATIQAIPTVTPQPTSTPAPIQAPGIGAAPTPFRWPGQWPVVRVTQGSSGFGNGVLISSTEVLTAFHVINLGSGQQIQVTLPAAAGGKNETRNTQVKGYDSASDIVLLTIQPIAVEDIDFAEPLTTAACANGASAVRNGDEIVIETTGDSATTFGIYRYWGRHSINVVSGRYLTDIRGLPGLSGSPVYNLSGRVLVGIVLQRDRSYAARSARWLPYSLKIG